MRAARVSYAVNVPEALVDEIVRRTTALVLELLKADHEPETRWLYGAQAAADYLDWPVGRVQKLTAKKRIPHHRLDDEQRVSYRTDELDAWLDEFYEGPRFLSSS
jgi:hypothetical protein